MDVSPRVKQTGFADDLLLELCVIHIDGGLDEEGGRWTGVADDNALLDEVATHLANIVFNGHGITAETVVAFDPIIVTAA